MVSPLQRRGEAQSAVQRATRETVHDKDPDQARRRALRLLDEQLGRIPREDRSPVACRAGCNFCCHLRVMATPPEVFGLLDYLQATLAADAFEAFRQRVEAAAERVGSLAPEQLLATNIACPVLVDGFCSGYAARPFNCRSYHSLDRDACEASFNDPGNQALQHPQFTAVARVHEGVQAGFIAGLKESGYDARQYELVTALHEALEDPASRERFENGEKTFLRPSPVG